MCWKAGVCVARWHRLDRGPRCKEIVNATAKDDGCRFSTIINGIFKSYPFRNVLERWTNEPTRRVIVNVSSPA